MSFDKTTAFVVIAALVVLVAVVAVITRGSFTSRIPGLKFQARGRGERSDVDVLNRANAAGLQADGVTGREKPSSKPGDTRVLNDSTLTNAKLGKIVGEGGGYTSKTTGSRSEQKGSQNTP